jgi:hypothetical protein
LKKSAQKTFAGGLSPPVSLWSRPGGAKKYTPEVTGHQQKFFWLLFFSKKVTACFPALPLN